MMRYMYGDGVWIALTFGSVAWFWEVRENNICLCTIIHSLSLVFSFFLDS